MNARLPIQPDLGFYRKLAKQLKRALQSGGETAAARFAASHPRFQGQPAASLRGQTVSLGEAQLVLAREHGFSSWSELRACVLQAVEDPRGSPAERLIEAIRSGDLAGAAALLEADRGLAGAQGADGRLPLVEACDRGALELVRLLLSAGADPVGADAHSTPMLAAAHAGPHKPRAALDVVECLIQHGAPDDLFANAALGRVEALRRALRDADVNSRGPLDCTALFLAAWNGHIEAVRALLAAGADPNLPCAGGQTAWQRVFLHVWSAAHREIARLLLEHGAQCSFHEACVLSHLPTVRRLLAVDPGAASRSDARGVAPLVVAVLNADADLARLLLESGAPDPKGQARALVEAQPEQNRSFARVVYRNCSFETANFHDSNLADATFSDVNLAFARFDNVNLSGVCIDNAYIKGLTIYGIEVEPLLVKELERRRAGQQQAR